MQQLLPHQTRTRLDRPQSARRLVDAQGLRERNVERRRRRRTGRVRGGKVFAAQRGEGEGAAPQIDRVAVGASTASDMGETKTEKKNEK